MRCATAVLALAGLLLAAGSAAGEGPRLRVLPDPPLDGVDGAVRDLLAAERAALAGALDDPDADPGRLFAGFARLGQLYLLYGLDAAAEDCFANARALAPQDGRWSYYLGVVHQRQGEYEQAVADLEQVLAVRAGDVATLVRLGRIELALGRADAAEGYFRRALEEPGGEAAAHHGLGQVAASRGRWPEAVDHFSRALEIDPGASSVQYELGLAYRELGDLERAREHLARRGTVLPGFPDPLVSGLDSLAVGPRPLLERGDAAFVRGDLAGAEAAFREAINVDPQNLRARRSLASVLALELRRSEAISAYREALRLAPDDAQLHQSLGVLLTRVGSLDDAIVHLRRGLELAPDDAGGWSNLARALEGAGRLDEAVEAAAAAAELLPGDSRATLALARLRLLHAVDPRKEPEAELRRLLASDPTDPMALLALGGLLEARGEPEEAMATYRRVLSEGPTEPARAPFEARAHLALARRLVAGDDDALLEHLRAAARLAPDLPQAHVALADALAARGEADEAVDAYRLALGLDAGDAAANAGLARALLVLGRCTEARALLERNLGRVEDGRELRALLERLRRTCGEADKEGAPDG